MIFRFQLGRRLRRRRLTAFLVSRNRFSGSGEGVRFRCCLATMKYSTSRSSQILTNAWLY